MAILQPVKPGLSAPIVTSIPDQWSKIWFRSFITNYLQNADVRNAVTPSGGGVSVTSTNFTQPATLALSSIPNDTAYGNVSGTTAPPSALTTTQLTTLINVFSTTASGAVPRSPGGPNNFLNADANWVTLNGVITAPPSALVGLTPVDGTALTVMTSDSAPSLDQSIAPTWTGDHIFLRGIVGGTPIGGTPSDGSVNISGQYLINGVPFIGPPGRKGRDGSDGRRGVPGFGTPGAQGPPGVAGASIPGRRGRDGNNGRTGPPGQTGSGGSGGGSLTLTDGTHTVTGTTQITVSGGTVGGTTPNATLTITAGGSSLSNVTPDTHPSIPTGVGLGPNDEFETGTTIDTAGSRYSGATAWTALNVGTGATAIVNSVAAGSLVLSGGATAVAASTLKGYVQPFTGLVTYQAKIAGFVQSAGGNTFGAGLVLNESATGKCVSFNFLLFSGALSLFTQTFSSPTVSVANLVSITLAPLQTDGTNTILAPLYLQVTVGTTTVSFSYSRTGVPGTFEPHSSFTTTAEFTVAPNMVGLIVNPDVYSVTSTNLAPAGVFDWFRRTA